MPNAEDSTQALMMAAEGLQRRVGGQEEDSASECVTSGAGQLTGRITFGLGKAQERCDKTRAGVAIPGGAALLRLQPPSNNSLWLE